jgi:ArsR family transcriptional regulator
MEQVKIVKIAKALADSTRYNILKMVAAHGEISCGELAEQFPIAQATVSHHLNILMNAELVQVRKQGQHHYFSLRLETVTDYTQALAVEFLPVPESQ